MSPCPFGNDIGHDASVVVGGKHHFAPCGTAGVDAVHRHVAQPTGQPRHHRPRGLRGWGRAVGVDEAGRGGSRRRGVGGPAGALLAGWPRKLRLKPADSRSDRSRPRRAGQSRPRRDRRGCGCGSAAGRTCDRSQPRTRVTTGTWRAAKTPNLGNPLLDDSMFRERAHTVGRRQLLNLITPPRFDLDLAHQQRPPRPPVRLLHRVRDSIPVLTARGGGGCERCPT